MKHNYMQYDIDIFNLIPNLLYLKVYSLFDRFQCTFYVNMPNMGDNSLPMEICSNNNIIYTKKVSILNSKKMDNCAKELIDNIFNKNRMNLSEHSVDKKLFSGVSTKGNIILEDLVKYALHPSKIIKILNETGDAYKIDNYI